MRARYLLASVVALSLAAAGLAADATRAEPSSAATVLSAFDPAHIIDDAVMFDGRAMDAGGVQSFLAAEQPTCTTGSTCLRSVVVDVPALPANPMCAAVPAAQAQTAAQVIATVGAACGVNPKVILVMLQKEQTLVTGRRPTGSETVASIYQKATGLGCPDTAACDPSKYGLFNQLYGVAYWLVRYTMPAGTGPGTAYSSNYNWFPVGTPTGVLYSPTASCGARTITIRNKATASLYYYTPYQPNAAALAAGWGTGDACSAYGNRNFFLYFTTWFGSTFAAGSAAAAPTPASTTPTPTATATPTPTVDPAAAAAATAITGAWAAAGGTSGSLGDATGTVTPVASGWEQDFAGGAIYCSARGTVIVPAAVRARYAAAGGPAGTLGLPIAAARAADRTTTTQQFEHGLVVAAAKGGGAIAAPLLAAWTKLGGGTGTLGWPTANAVTGTGGVSQAFTGGRLVVTSTRATVVAAPVLARWQQQATGLGWPTGPAVAAGTKANPVTLQSFQSGAVIARSAGVFAVSGPIWKDWTAHRAQRGSLGWPRAAAATSTANGGGTSQRFTGGTIYWSAKSGAHPLTGKELALYNALGGTKGPLGWPGARHHVSAGRGGAVTTFTHGRIYSSTAATVAVTGKVLTKYLAKGGPSGSLGWPTAAARTSHGVVTQTFEHGRIQVSR